MESNPSDLCAACGHERGLHFGGCDLPKTPGCSNYGDCREDTRGKRVRCTAPGPWGDEWPLEIGGPGGGRGSWCCCHWVEPAHRSEDVDSALILGQREEVLEEEADARIYRQEV